MATGAEITGKAVGAGHKGAEGLMANGVRKGVSLSHWFVAMPVVAGGLSLISLWDNRVEKNRIRDEYRDEIAGRLGINAKDVTTDHLEKVAEENPVIAEALRRNTAKTKLSIGVTIAATVAMLAVVALAAPAIGGLMGTAHLLVEGAIGFFGFMGAEHVLTKAGEKNLGLEDVDAKEVERNPRLLAGMSVPNQVTYLAGLQGAKKAITQEQVMTVLASAGGGLAAQIESRFGAPFAALSEEQKRAALMQLGEEYNIGQLTDDLNSQRIRAQELAFTAYGRTSAPTEANTTQRKIAFASSRVSGAVPGYVPPQVSTKWRRFITDQRQAKAQVMGA